MKFVSRHYNRCRHVWKEDKRFASGEVMMFFGSLKEIKRETRFVCARCGTITYRSKENVRL